MNGGCEVRYTVGRHPPAGVAERQTQRTQNPPGQPVGVRIPLPALSTISGPPITDLDPTLDPTLRRPQGPVSPVAGAARPIDPGVTIGHAHLRTADIDRAGRFYVDVLGFDVVMDARGVPGWGTTGDMLFVSAGGCRHHLGFSTWLSAGGGPTPNGVAGLHHVALRYPTRAGLADALRRLRAGGWPIRDAEDQGTHEAIYVVDPDGDTLELSWDRPFAEWPRDEVGHVATTGGALDL